MKHLRITLTDEEYDWVKQKGRLWPRKLVQHAMEHPAVDPDYSPEPIPAPKWWEVWK